MGRLYLRTREGLLGWTVALAPGACLCADKEGRIDASFNRNELVLSPAWSIIRLEDETKGSSTEVGRLVAE
jgi:hypothetical protein